MCTHCILQGYHIGIDIDCVTSLESTDDEDVNRMGEKVILREQVKELFNKKYGSMAIISTLSLELYTV